MLYEMMFVKDFGAFKKGQKTECSKPVADKWKASGVAVDANEPEAEQPKKKTKSKKKAEK